MASNNDYLNDIASEERGIKRTNNQLLEIIAAGGGGGGGSAVTSVNGKTGDVVLDKSDIGLSNVDDTSDANKPVSTATQAALNGKVDKSGDTMTGTLQLETVGFGNVVQVVRDSVNVGRIDTNAFSGGGFRIQSQTGELQLRGSGNTGLRVGDTAVTGEIPLNMGANQVSSTFVPTDDQHLTNKLYVDQQVASAVVQPATHVDPSTGTVEDVINALIDAGLMQSV